MIDAATVASRAEVRPRRSRGTVVCVSVLIRHMHVRCGRPFGIWEPGRGAGARRRSDRAICACRRSPHLRKLVSGELS